MILKVPKVIVVGGFLRGNFNLETCVAIEQYIVLQKNKTFLYIILNLHYVGSDNVISNSSLL